MKEQNKKILTAMAFMIFILFMIVAGYFIGSPMIRLVQNPGQFRSMVGSYGIWGRLVFVGMVVLQVVVAFIPGEPIELAAGYAFGFWEGTILTLMGFIIGSLIVFLLVRKFGIRMVEVFFSRDKINRFSFLQDPEKTKTLAFILMLIPGTPKDFLSYFAGLTQLPLKAWLLIVAVGRLPSLITSTATGAAAGKKDYLLSAIMLGVTAVLTVSGLLYYNSICKREREKEKA
jgi:uncharacterized membrane protein YdjX (TVP38/TMEM64 family)